MWRKALISFFIITGAAVLAFADKGEDLIENAKAMSSSQESCIDVVDNHRLLIEKSEEYFADLVRKSDDEFKSYDVVILQKILKARYDHLQKLMAMFASSSDCNLPVLGQVMAAYDFNLLARNTMKVRDARRMIHSFTKVSEYGMASFKRDYQYYTDIDNVKKIRQTLTDSEIGLMQFFGLTLNLKKSGIAFSTFTDRAKRAWDWTVGGAVIKPWGYLSDALKVRHGYLRDNLQVRELVRKNLKPLDLIFEKRRFLLSNLTIPGHWGHVAIWLGTKDELVELGVWDKDFFTPFRKHVEQGRNIVQMRKEGIVFNSLEEFMDLDEVAINRVVGVQNNVLSVYQLAFENLGKKYDFSFDAKSLGKITCTELITFSFGNILWPSHYSLGRLVIRPDDIARLTLNSTESQFVLYVHSEGDQVHLKTEDDWKNLLLVDPK